MAGCMPGYDVELGTAAAVDVIVAAGADHAVAMHQPCAAKLRIACCWKAVRESNLGCVGVRIYERCERNTPCGALELGCEGALRILDGTLAIRICPLHNVVVLGSDDRHAIVIAFARQCLDVRRMVGRELRCQLDDDSARGKLQVQGVLWVERAPVSGG